jgi:hypothetical protein
MLLEDTIRYYCYYQCHYYYYYYDNYYYYYYFRGNGITTILPSALKLVTSPCSMHIISLEAIFFNISTSKSDMTSGLRASNRRFTADVFLARPSLIHRSRRHHFRETSWCGLADIRVSVLEV